MALCTRGAIVTAPKSGVVGQSATRIGACRMQPPSVSTGYIPRGVLPADVRYTGIACLLFFDDNSQLFVRTRIVLAQKTQRQPHGGFRITTLHCRDRNLRAIISLLSGPKVSSLTCPATHFYRECGMRMPYTLQADNAWRRSKGDDRSDKRKAYSFDRKMRLTTAQQSRTKKAHAGACSRAVHWYLLWGMHRSVE